MTENKQIVLAAQPKGSLETSHYELRTGPVPKPGDGEVLCRTLAITIGAGQRASLQGGYGPVAKPETAEAMPGSGVARVEASNEASLPTGSVVMGATGWQDYAVLKAADLLPVDAALDPALHLGPLGINGLAAYFGLLDIGQPAAGQTVLVSAAAGSVGHMVGQIAKLKGCRVVGVAGSDEKCAILQNELGFDVAINYKDPEFRAAFKAATPDGIDIYFDNTGGDILGAALFRMKEGGRIVCCGVVSQYDTANPEPGPRGIPGLLVTKRMRMEGFVVYDYASDYAQARKQIRSWIESGELVPRMTEFTGLESAPGAFVELLGGGTVGSTIVRVAS